LRGRRTGAAASIGSANERYAPASGDRLNRTLLLVSTATQWLGTARMPRVLARAGFDVALLAPPDSIAAKSRYVSTVRYLAAHASPLEFLAELTKMIDAVTPVLLVPCDEMAVRLLFALVLTPPA